MGSTLPPYVRTERIPSEDRNYFIKSGQFSCAYKKFDLYVLFIERALKLLCDGGYLGFIVPYPFLNQSYAEPLRRLILDSTCIESIVDLSDYKVFEAATVETCIIILKKELNKSVRESHKVRVIAQTSYDLGVETNGNGRAKIRQSIFDQTPQAMFRLDLASDNLSLTAHIERGSFRLGQLYYISKGIVAYAESTGKKKSDFLHKKRVNKRCVPYLEGKDVQRYVTNFKGWHLDYQPDIMARPTFRELHESPKLLVRALAQGLWGTRDTLQYYADQKLICCVQYGSLGEHRQVRPPADVIKNSKYDDRYILGLLNSCVIGYYYRVVLFSGLSILPEDVRRLPIRQINFSDNDDKRKHDSLVKLVEKMLELQKEFSDLERNYDNKRPLIKKQIDKVDAEIDALVYDLYELSSDEIAVVQNSGSKS